MSLPPAMTSAAHKRPTMLGMLSCAWIWRRPSVLGSPRAMPLHKRFRKPENWPRRRMPCKVCSFVHLRLTLGELLRLQSVELPQAFPVQSKGLQRRPQHPLLATACSVKEHVCVYCGDTFALRRLLATQSRRHQVLTPARHFAPEPHCVACLRFYHTVQRLQSHLRHSSKCMHRALQVVRPLLQPKSRLPRLQGWRRQRPLPKGSGSSIRQHRQFSRRSDLESRRLLNDFLQTARTWWWQTLRATTSRPWPCSDGTTTTKPQQQKLARWRSHNRTIGREGQVMRHQSKVTFRFTPCMSFGMLPNKGIDGPTQKQKQKQFTILKIAM